MYVATKSIGKRCSSMPGVKSLMKIMKCLAMQMTNA